MATRTLNGLVRNVPGPNPPTQPRPLLRNGGGGAGGPCGAASGPGSPPTHPPTHPPPPPWGRTTLKQRSDPTPADVLVHAPPLAFSHLHLQQLPRSVRCTRWCATVASWSFLGCAIDKTAPNSPQEGGAVN